jgi:hypothetical protein
MLDVLIFLLEVVRSKKLITPLAANMSDFVGISLTESENEDVKEYSEPPIDELQWVGVSDLAIGGRCKCNGHASECSLDKTTGDIKDLQI